jgi:hypothetical protein
LVPAVDAVVTGIDRVPFVGLQIAVDPKIALVVDTDRGIEPEPGIGTGTGIPLELPIPCSPLKIR